MICICDENFVSSLNFSEQRCIFKESVVSLNRNIFSKGCLS